MTLGRACRPRHSPGSQRAALTSPALAHLGQELKARVPHLPAGAAQALLQHREKLWGGGAVQSGQVTATHLPAQPRSPQPRDSLGYPGRGRLPLRNCWVWGSRSQQPGVLGELSSQLSVAWKAFFSTWRGQSAAAAAGPGACLPATSPCTSLCHAPPPAPPPRAWGRDGGRRQGGCAGLRFHGAEASGSSTTDLPDRGKRGRPHRGPASTGDPGLLPQASFRKALGTRRPVTSSPAASPAAWGTNSAPAGASLTWAVRTVCVQGPR